MSDDGSDGGEVYEVEKILEKRVKKGKTEYLIKWKGMFQKFFPNLTMNVDHYIVAFFKFFI